MVIAYLILSFALGGIAKKVEYLKNEYLFWEILQLHKLNTKGVEKEWASICGLTQENLK